jgi:hypothetical protein
VDGRQVFAFAQDFTVFGGSLSETHAQKILKVQDLAMKARAPIIGLFDAGGVFLAEDDNSGGGRNARIERQVPGGTYRVWANTLSGRKSFPMKNEVCGRKLPLPLANSTLTDAPLLSGRTTSSFPSSISNNRCFP